VGYLPAEEIDNNFRNQYGFDTYEASVEYLVLRRAKDSKIEDIDDKDNRNNVFAGYTSLPGGVNNYGENSLDSVVRNTYEQTGYDLKNYYLTILIDSTLNT
jgi:8-oxo-dGTP pyrophosphatase MutT (NUDIX family)